MHACYRTTAVPSPTLAPKRRSAGALQLPAAAYGSQGVAREPNGAGTHLCAQKGSDFQLLPQMGNRMKKPLDSTVQAFRLCVKIPPHVTPSYHPPVFLGCVGRMSLKQKGPLGTVAKAARI